MVIFYFIFPTFSEFGVSLPTLKVQSQRNRDFLKQSKEREKSGTLSSNSPMISNFSHLISPIFFFFHFPFHLKTVGIDFSHVSLNDTLKSRSMRHTARKKTLKRTFYFENWFVWRLLYVRAMSSCHFHLYKVYFMSLYIYKDRLKAAIGKK